MATTRREFLRRSASAVVGLGVAGRGVVSAAVSKATTPAAGPRDPVIVALFLAGGNDALNTIVPLAEYDLYRQLRPRLALAPERLVPLPGYETDFGLNPGLAALADLFDAGKVAIVNGVGPPSEAYGLFNHEGSQRMFLTATIDGGTDADPTGWLGRAVDGLERGDLPRAVALAGSGQLLTGQSEKPLVLPSIEALRADRSGDFAARAAAYRTIQSIARGLPATAEDNRALRVEVLEFSDTLLEIADAHAERSSVVYPSGPLGAALRDCAAVIAADRGVRALAVSANGFDTHAIQNFRARPNDVLGFHDLLLADVGASVAAFSADVEAAGVGDRVVLLVFSEFGRRAADNAGFGTDHGFGSTMFVVGERVRGGIYGDYPSLDGLVLGGNLAAPIDFRSVYATLLARHLDVDPEPVLRGSFPALGFLA